MAIKRTKRVSFAGFSVHELNPDDFDWIQLKAAYGHEFSADAQRKIVEATRSYFIMAGFELAAEPISVAVKKVRGLQKSAKQFRQSIIREQNNPNFWGYNLGDHLPSNPHTPNKLLESLKEQLKAFDDACERAVKDLGSSPMNATLPPDGTGWNVWIFRLTQIARDFGLPEGARNDSDKQQAENISEFIRLIMELQSQIPKQFRRPYASPHALAKAVNRAREDCARDRKATRRVAKKSRKPRSESM
jgi:hypothetical protein